MMIKNRVKQKYRPLLVLIISIFSVSSVSCVRQQEDVGKDFDFIMQSLKASDYSAALQGNGERWGIQKFDEEDPIFKMADKEGNTMLHAAIQASNDVQDTITRMSVMNEMLKKCPDLLSIENVQKNSPLEDAFARKQDALLVYLLTKEEGQSEPPHQEAMNDFLQLADQNNLIKTAKYLIEKGAFVTIQGSTMLHYVVKKYDDDDCKDIIDVIIKRQPDLLNARDKDGNTPLTIATNLNKTNTAKYLTEKGALLTIEGSKMLECIVTNRAEDLIEKGALFTTEGSTILHYVVTNLDDCEGIIDAILKRQPDLLNAEDNNIDTPFMIATSHYKIKAVRHLLIKENLNITTTEDNALLWAISANEPVDRIKSMLDKYPVLLEEYSDEEHKRYLLHEVIEKVFGNKKSFGERPGNLVSIINELIKRKPDILKEKNEEGKTALQYAQELGGELMSSWVIPTLEAAEKTSPQQPSIKPQSRSPVITKLPSSPEGTSTLGDTSPDVSDKSKNPVGLISTGSDNKSRTNPAYYVGLVGVPVALGIMYYGIKKMLKTKDKPTDEHAENQGVKTIYAD